MTRRYARGSDPMMKMPPVLGLGDANAAHAA
jgi:hypothetical protein